MPLNNYVLSLQGPQEPGCSTRKAQGSLVSAAGYAGTPLARCLQLHILMSFMQPVSEAVCQGPCLRWGLPGCQRALRLGLAWQQESDSFCAQDVEGSAVQEALEILDPWSWAEEDSHGVPCSVCAGPDSFVRECFPLKVMSVHGGHNRTFRERGRRTMGCVMLLDFLTLGLCPHTLSGGGVSTIFTAKKTVTLISHIQVVCMLSNAFLTVLFDIKLRSRIVLHDDW